MTRRLEPEEEVTCHGAAACIVRDGVVSSQLQILHLSPDPFSGPMSTTADPLSAQSSSLSNSSSPSSSRDADTKRHEHFWFEDGNIVLVAQQTAFKVYRGLLSAQSTVFFDMFQASCRDESEIFADSPMIHLSDSPHDLAYFLEALMQLNERQ